MVFGPFIAAAYLVLFAVADPTVYLIRHGEKPKNGDGLSKKGKERAQCLRGVFGEASSYNIGLIMAEDYNRSGGRQRPYDTVQPLADDLGLTVDTQCARDDAQCVADVVDQYDGTGNILICWEHARLTDIASALGARDPPSYPSDAFNLIWTDTPPFDSIADISSENCPGLDD